MYPYTQSPPPYLINPSSSTHFPNTLASFLYTVFHGKRMDQDTSTHDKLGTKDDDSKTVERS